MNTNGAAEYDDFAGIEYEELFGELKVLVRAIDPVPLDVIEAARGSATWQTVDAELAHLVYDSVYDEELAGVRGGGARQLTFETSEVTVEVEFDAASGRLNGQLVPPAAAEVEVRHPGGSVKADADHLGHFRADGVPPGPVSLRCRIGGPTQRAAHTDWIVL